MIELHSTDVPAAERFQWWCDLTARQMVPTEISSDHTEDFRASVTVLELGQVTLTSSRFADMRSTRTRRLILQSDPEQWWLTLVRAGSMWLEQGRTRTRLVVGDLVLHDTSRPYRCGAAHRGGGLAHSITLHLPRRALPVPERSLRDRVARPMPWSGGTAALLGRFMDGLLKESATLSPAECPRLGTVVTGLVAALLSGEDRTAPALTQRQTLVSEVKTFVRRHLARPDLSPSVIAAAHNVSVRTLHHAFAQEEETVCGHIRRQRLERCRADLADPGLTGRGVAQIAARWGFPDAASFSRTFKTEYGMPPGEYRKVVQRRRLLGR